MRRASILLACALATGAGAAAAPGVAGAAPLSDRGLTIHAAPNPALAGEGVLIYGRLGDGDRGGQTIRLYHRIAGAPAFSLISTTTTNALGEYEFTRAEGIVMTNRNWYVRGPAGTHSDTIHERVAALVTLAASASGAATRQALTFSGHVTPAHPGAVLALQEQSGASNEWVTLKRGVVGPGSNYNISYAWRTAGAYEVRVWFGGDARNVAAPSDVLPVVIQQAELPGFTIATSSPIVANGQPVTISGVLDQPGTTTPEPDTSVSLWGRAPGVAAFREIDTTTTGADGSYSFAGVQSTTNEIYQVRTTFAPRRHSAPLFEGVQDVVGMTADSQISTVNGHVTFSGMVSPDKSGHVIYLQKEGSDDNWHTVEVSTVTRGSTFHFGWTFGTAGTKVFRARITGGPANVGSASAPVTIDVTMPPLTSLPTG